MTTPRPSPGIPRMQPAPVSRLVAAVALTALAATACAPDDAEQAESPAPTATATQPSPSDEASPTAAASPSPSPTESATEEATYTVEAPRATEVLAERDEELRFTDPWDPAPDAEALAERIARAEEAARDESLTPDQRETAGFEAQMAYRQLTETSDWLEDVLAELPEDLHPVARGNVEAREALDRLLAEHAAPPTTVPAWRIVSPAPADELVQYYKEAAEQIGVEWEYLAAINLVETRMGRIRGYSTAMARGPMQFIPESWEIFGEGGDIDDERDSIFAAARHLKGRDWDKGPRAALLRYNRSSNYGDAVIAYAEVLQQDPDAYATYHGWQVLYQPGDDVFVFPVGYEESEPVPLDEYRQRPVVEISG